MTLEERVLDGLHHNEGQEAFNLPWGKGGPKSASNALQRLKRKGLAHCAQAPDGAWIWWRTEPHPDDAD